MKGLERFILHYMNIFLLKLPLGTENKIAVIKVRFNFKVVLNIENDFFLSLKICIVYI